MVGVAEQVDPVPGSLGVAGQHALVADDPAVDVQPSRGGGRGDPGQVGPGHARDRVGGLVNSAQDLRQPRRTGGKAVRLPRLGPELTRGGPARIGVGQATKTEHEAARFRDGRGRGELGVGRHDLPHHRRLEPGAARFGEGTLQAAQGRRGDGRLPEGIGMSRQHRGQLAAQVADDGHRVRGVHP
ncbi:MAG TPA: hypothetical protein VGG75_06000 [Trebonia sp.]